MSNAQIMAQDYFQSSKFDILSGYKYWLSVVTISLVI